MALLTDIFLVDDDMSILEVYRDVLKIGGHNITAEARDGAEAVEKYRSLESKPDIVIMDHRMPVMNGMDAMREIRNMEPLQTVIFVTADFQAAKQALKQGASSFVLKPFRMDDLFNSIETVSVMNRDRRNELRGRMLEMVAWMKEDGPGRLTTLCQRIDDEIIGRFLPASDDTIPVEVAAEWICQFLNIMEMKYSYEMQDGHLLLRNKKCIWLDKTGPNPSLCFLSKCVISRFAGRTGLEFSMNMSSAIMDHSEECLFEVIFPRG